METALGPYQEALYAAEHVSIDRVGLSWHRRADVQAYVTNLVESSWFFERWPWFVRCIVERRGHGSRWSTCRPLDDAGPGGRPTEGVILLADGAARQPVVLHELAHLLAPPDAGHGPPFAATLLTLVRAEMGFFAFAEFRDALRAPAPSLFAGIDAAG